MQAGAVAIRPRTEDAQLAKGEESTKQRARPYDLTTAGADYPPWSGAPRRTLVICTQQRSGSTLLGEAITFAGGLGCPLEYFHVGFRPYFEDRCGTGNWRSYAAAVQRIRTDPSGTYSVKLFWRDLIDLVCDLATGRFDGLSQKTPPLADMARYRQIHETITEIFPSPVFVFLFRRDAIAQAVSQSVAGQTNHWRQRAGAPSKGQAHYNFHEIVQRLAEVQNQNLHWRNYFHANALRPYEVAYEDLAGSYETALRGLFHWLERPDAVVVPPRLEKQADASSEALARAFLEEFRKRAGEKRSDN